MQRDICLFMSSLRPSLSVSPLFSCQEAISAANKTQTIPFLLQLCLFLCFPVKVLQATYLICYVMRRCLYLQPWHTVFLLFTFYLPSLALATVRSLFFVYPLCVWEYFTIFSGLESQLIICAWILFLWAL